MVKQPLGAVERVESGELHSRHFSLYPFFVLDGVFPLIIEHVAQGAIGIHMPVGIRLEFSRATNPFFGTSKMGTALLPVRPNGVRTLGRSFCFNTGIRKVQCSMSSRNPSRNIARQRGLDHFLMRMDRHASVLKVRPQQVSQLDCLGDDVNVEFQGLPSKIGSWCGHSCAG